MKERKFGWKRENPDHRDPVYALTLDMEKPIPLPSHVDLEKVMPSVEDQDVTGDCVAFALGGCLEHMEILSIAQKNIKAPEYFSAGFEPLSKLYLYWYARLRDGTTNVDQGTTIRSAILATQSWGMCRDQLWPYNETRVFDRPSPTASTEAVKHKLVEAYRIDHTNGDEIKQCLARGFPIAFGMSLGKSYMSAEVARTGIVPELVPHEEIVGGHAQSIIGYDDAKGRYKVRNSWSASWGDHGHAWILYSALEGKMASDFWTLRPKSA